ncbi:uncharacterized protein LOC143797167 [Ranitomeya variabilis]|uniref:uncharacterized protein LOC143797167 n=1 Tax=Ranitomeya variabilis TaxID=490064 RepID=UPI004056E07C
MDYEQQQPFWSIYSASTYCENASSTVCVSCKRSEAICRIVRDQAAAACLQCSLHNRNLLIPNLQGNPPQKLAKVTKKVVEKGKKKKQPRRLSSPHLKVSKQPAKKRRNIAVDEEPLDIENETLITLVEANLSIWDQSDSSHHDIIKNQKLWEKIICQLDPGYLDKSASSKRKIADAVHTRWRSIRDRFVRDFCSSQNTPSGSGGKRVTPYVHYEQLLFLQKTSQRSTICSTDAPREA